MRNVLFAALLLGWLSVLLTAAPTHAADPEVKASEDGVRQSLAKVTAFEFTNVPLDDALGYVEGKHDLFITFDERALEEVGFKTDTPVTMTTRGTSLRAALRYLLQPLQLGFVVRGGTVLITTEGEAYKALTTRIYDVHDLVNEASDFEPLIKILTRHVKPTSWNTVGGAGEITPLSTGAKPLLVVSQYEEAQDAVEDLLADLRAVLKPAASQEKK